MHTSTVHYGYALMDILMLLIYVFLSLFIPFEVQYYKASHNLNLLLGQHMT